MEMEQLVSKITAEVLNSIRSQGGLGGAFSPERRVREYSGDDRPYFAEAGRQRGTDQKALPGSDGNIIFVPYA